MQSIPTTSPEATAAMRKDLGPTDEDSSSFVHPNLHYYHEHQFQWLSSNPVVMQPHPYFVDPHSSLPLYHHQDWLAIMQRLKQQVEFYFSYENLLRDDYLVNQMLANQGLVPCQVLGCFPRVLDIVGGFPASPQLLGRALSSSSVVRVHGHYLYPLTNALHMVLHLRTVTTQRGPSPTSGTDETVTVQSSENSVQSQDKADPKEQGDNPSSQPEPPIVVEPNTDDKTETPACALPINPVQFPEASSSQRFAEIRNGVETETTPLFHADIKASYSNDPAFKKRHYPMKKRESHDTHSNNQERQLQLRRSKQHTKDWRGHRPSRRKLSSTSKGPSPTMASHSNDTTHISKEMQDLKLSDEFK